MTTRKNGGERPLGPRGTMRISKEENQASRAAVVTLGRLPGVQQGAWHRLESLATPTLVPGQLLDKKYEVQQLVGEGGFGRVYQAKDRRLGRLVAIKELRDNGHRRLFEREARLMGALEHVNVVSIYDCVEQEGRLYLVMAYVPGETLTESIRRAVPTLPLVVEMLVQIASGLQAVHEVKVVHRDIKPDNVICHMNGPNGDRLTLKLTDFGIAKRCADASPMSTAAPPSSASGVAVDTGLCGTPHYMAKELAAGGKPTVLSDVYALCTLAYELLTGNLPYDQVIPDGRDEASCILARQMSDAPVPHIADRGKEIPSLLAEIVMKGLEKDPAKRWQSADEFREALEELRRDEPEFRLSSPGSTRTSSRLSALRKPERSRKRLWGLLALLGLILLSIVGMLVVTVIRQSGKNGGQPATLASGLATPAISLVPSATTVPSAPAPPVPAMKPQMPSAPLPVPVVSRPTPAVTATAVSSATVGDAMQKCGADPLPAAGPNPACVDFCRSCGGSNKGGHPFCKTACSLSRKRP